MESTKTVEEILSEHKNWTYVRTDRNGTKYFSDCTCSRCGGIGKIDAYAYIDGGVCYECGGSGIGKPQEIKVYTPEHAAKLAAQRKARAQKMQEKAAAERDNRLLSIGFAKEGDEFCLYRIVGNTYAIKDELKELGCKFNPSVGWYTNHELEGYECQRLTEKEVLNEGEYLSWKSKSAVSSLLKENQNKEESPSRWQGDVGARVEIDVHVDKVIEFDSYYGINFMHLMADKAGNVYKWSTAKRLEEGKDYHLRATIKDHAEYKGVQQTVVTRASIIA